MVYQQVIANKFSLSTYLKGIIKKKKTIIITFATTNTDFRIEPCSTDPYRNIAKIKNKNKKNTLPLPRTIFGCILKQGPTDRSLLETFITRRDLVLFTN